MTTAVRKIIEEVKALNHAERLELEAALREADTAPISDEEVARRLASQGGVTLAQRAPHKAHPVPITGQPVSEIIIADRR